MTVPAISLLDYYDPTTSVEVRCLDGSLYHDEADAAMVLPWIEVNALEGVVRRASSKLVYLRMTMSVEQANEAVASKPQLSLGAVEARRGSAGSNASQTIIRQREIGPLVFAHKLNVYAGVA